MINKENVLQTAQALVRQYNLPLQLLGVEEGTEEVTIYFTAKKRPKLRELVRELEFQLNLPIKLERIKRSELGKVGGINILGNQPCCASFLRKCPFGGKYGCGYGFAGSQFTVHSSPQKDEKSAEAKPPKPQRDKKKKRKKVVRRVVLKGRS